MRKKLLCKDDVLTIAEKIIEKDGLDHCSMRHIAKQLGVAVGTVYNYYKSREELLNELFKVSWQRTIHNIKSCVDETQDKITQIDNLCESLNMEIEKRNGLGKEVFNNDLKSMKDHSKFIKYEIEIIIRKIICQNSEASNINDILSNWILAILFDKILKGQGFSTCEKAVLAHMIDSNYETE